jgi:HEAT repeat protein
MSLQKLFRHRKSRSRALLLLLVMAAAALLGRSFMVEKDRSPAANEPTVQAIKPSRPQVDLSALAERAGGPPPLTLKQVKEEAQIDKEQVTLAGGWLHSADPQQRIDGAEQLSAYPTREAENLLSGALTADPDPQVRSVAAQSLGSFKKPSEKAITALLVALEDRSQEVQMSAFNALQGIVDRQSSDSARYKKILAQMKKELASRRTAAATKQLIREFIKDQESLTR